MLAEYCYYRWKVWEYHSRHSGLARSTKLATQLIHCESRGWWHPFPLPRDAHAALPLLREGVLRQPSNPRFLFPCRKRRESGEASQVAFDTETKPWGLMVGAKRPREEAEELRARLEIVAER